MNPRSRNRVTRTDLHRVLVVAAVAGLVASITDLQPTGARAVDRPLVALATAVVVWAGATTPWWILAAVGVVATASAGSFGPLSLALLATAIAAWIGSGHRNLPWLRSISAAGTVMAFSLSTLHGFFGLTAALGCTSAAVIVVAGTRRTSRPQRRIIARIALATCGLAAFAVVAFALAAQASRSALLDGNRLARAGLSALNDGDTTAAATELEAAAAAFRSADDTLSAPWVQPVRLLPVVAQHRNAVEDLSSVAADALENAAVALRQIDPETVRVIDGHIDLEAVRALEQPFSALHDAIADLDHVVGRHRSSWLVRPAQRELGELQRELEQNRFRAENARLAVQIAPRMLGADAPRTYFVAFTTPAEARGVSGFMGNWAELTIDDGTIEMTRFGRSSDLTFGGDATTRRLDGPDELLAHWGRFGLATGPAGTTDLQVWTNLTMVPDFPTFAQAVQQLSPQSDGPTVDGVFLLDPQAIAALLRFTGPITIDGVDQPISADNAANFILRDQYLLDDNDERVDLLDSIARAAVDGLLSSALPPPADLANVFAPLAAEGRFLAWSSVGDEQELLRRVRLDGTFPQLDGADGVSVTVDNAGPNKIDAYLDLDVDYVVADNVVTVTLTNGAPRDGLPAYVIGNGSDRPLGTNRMWLSVYTGRPMSAVTINGTPSSMQTTAVFGWNVASRFIDIPPGSTVVVRLTVDGRVANPTAPIVRRVQPLVNPTDYAIISD